MDRAPSSAYDPGTYGRSFADVYDEWYPPDAATDSAVQVLSDLAGPEGEILELGVGTGRLALPLLDRGHPVSGVDSSPEMLDQLRRRLADTGGDPRRLSLVQGDVADGQIWPRGPFRVVVAAFNLICNLVDPRDQEAVFSSAAGVLASGGALVVEAFEPAEDVPEGPQLELSSVTSDSVVMIASERGTDGVVTGQHIELRDGAPVRLRPWRIRPTDPDDLDRWATSAGLELRERRAGWTDHFDDAASGASPSPPISIYSQHTQ